MTQHPSFRFCLRALVLFGIVVWAQGSRPAMAGALEVIGRGQGDEPGQISGFEHVRIDSIMIDNRNVYDLTDRQYNRFPFRTANKLHLVTRRSVIERELLFNVGDPFSRDLAEETARNLRTRLALYEAWVETEALPDGRLLVRVVTIDQWSLILFARLAREGNITDIRFGFEERNLLGRNQLLSFEYFITEEDRDHANATYSNQRLFGKELSMKALYDTDPRNELRQVTVSRPFYNLNQSNSWSATVRDAKGRVDDPTNDRRLFSSSDQAQFSYVNRWGSYRNKLFVTTDYTYRHSRSYATPYLHPEIVSSPAIDTTYHRVMLYTGFQRIEYVGMKRINGFNYTEDVELGLTISLGSGRAFTPDWKSYHFDQLSFGITSAFRLGNGLVILGYDRTGWVGRNHPTVQSADMSVRYYETSLTFATLAVRARYRSDERDSTLYLGGTSGIRGYERNFQGGNRLLVTNTEVRLFPGLELLSVRFGGALFIDAGRAFRPSERFSVGHLVTSFGGGLRFSFERTTRSELARIDFARTRVIKDGRPQSVWEVSVGSGQYF